MNTEDMRQHFEPDGNSRRLDGGPAGADSLERTGSALRESMDAARNTVAYWKEAYDTEREENLRLRARLRETKKYLRDANRGARILSLAFQLATANKVIRHMQSSQNNPVSDDAKRRSL